MPAGRLLKLPKTIQEHDFSLLAKKEKHARTRIRFWRGNDKISNQVSI